jgi:type IV secretion system protein VirB3
MAREPDKLRMDPVYGGLTRPAMALGVPYVAAVLEGTVVMLMFAFSKNLMTLLLILPLHGLLFALSVYDPDIFQVYRKWLDVNGRVRSVMTWKGRSFACGGRQW